MSLEYVKAWTLAKICEEIDKKDAAPTCVMVCGKDGEAKQEFVKSLTSRLKNVVLHDVQEFSHMTTGFLRIMGFGYLVVLDEKQSFDFAFRKQLSSKIHHAGARTVIGVYVEAKDPPAPEGEDDIRIYQWPSKDEQISIPQASEFDAFIRKS